MEFVICNFVRYRARRTPAVATAEDAAYPSVSTVSRSNPANALIPARMKSPLALPPPPFLIVSLFVLLYIGKVSCLSVAGSSLQFRHSRFGIAGNAKRPTG